MNSCRSIEFCAWAPPLITFSIGTGSVPRVLAAEVAVERDAGLGGGRLRGRERDAEDRVGAEPALVRRAVAVDQRRVERRPGRRRRAPSTASRSAPLTFATACVTPLPPQAVPPSRSSTASWTPVEAPEGTAAARAPRTRAGRRPRPSGSRASRAPAARARRVICSHHARLLRELEVSILLRRGRATRQSSPGRRREPLGLLDPRAEALGGRAQLELGVDVEPPRDVHAGEEDVAELGGHARGRARAPPPARPGSRRAARAAPRRGRRARRRRPGSRSRPPPRGAAPCGRAAAPGSVSGTSWKTPSRPSCSTLSRSQFSRTRPGRRRLDVAEDVRMARDQLRVHVPRHRLEIALRRARTGAARGSTTGRAGRRARRAASRRRRRAPRRRPRRPPRPCAARSSARSARDPRGSRGAGARSAPGARPARRRAATLDLARSWSWFGVVSAAHGSGDGW